MKIVVVKKVVYTTILTEIGQIVVWTTFRTTTFSPSIKTTILQFALFFVKILQSLFGHNFPAKGIQLKCKLK